MNTYTIQRIAAFLDSWLMFRFNQTTLPGMSVAVLHKQDIIFTAQYGLANAETATVLDEHSLFSVASQSKMMTAVALLQLYENGSLDLDAPVCNYVPWLADHPQTEAKEVTVRQLLTHGAGFARDLPSADFWMLQKPFPSSSSLRGMLIDTPILVRPNTQLKYSNAGYTLLGEVIQSVSGQSYASYITQHIINALNLPQTYADHTARIAPHVAVGYGVTYASRRTPLGPRRATHAFAPVAGVHSTCADMCRFAAALCAQNDTLLRLTTKKEMLRTQRAQPDGYDAGLEFGLGVEIIPVGERRVMGHGGHLAGHVTATYFDRDSEISVAVMVNSKDAPTPRIALGIFGAIDFFSQHAVRPAPADVERLSARLLSPIATVEIIATNSQIIAIDPDDWEPFAFQEELEKIDASALRIVTPGSVFNQSETVHYLFKDNILVSARYAGGTLWPEHTFIGQ
ncbi:MAG TPA: serine hydrolase domain-containing protein [Candidatus Saccharimonadales bacterium]|nr:serine hydrolase domain-containing protein [Candidatus Saccharimonadales bacterium]